MLKRLLTITCMVVAMAGWAGTSSGQYLWMDTNGDGVNTAADQMGANGTPTTIDVWLNTTTNKNGSPAVCQAGDPDAFLSTWNSFATHIDASGGTVTYSNYINRVTAFTIACSNAGLAFASNSVSMAQCQATGVPTSNGGVNLKLFTVTVTGTSGAPSLAFVPTNSLDQNPTSFGSPCGGAEFDNTIKLGLDFFDADGIGPAAGGTNQPPIVSAPATVNGAENAPVSVTASASDPDASDLVTLSQTHNAAFLTGPASSAPSATPSITLTGTPSFTQAGTYTVNWSAADNGTPTMTGVASTSVVIANTDRPPTVTAPPSVIGNEGSLISFMVTASDPDGTPIDGIGAAGSAMLAGASFTSIGGSGTFSWTPSFTQAGVYSATFSAGPGSATTSITVNNVDHAPVVTAPASRSVATGSLVTIIVNAGDPDGDAITNLTAAPLPSGATFTKNAANTSGTFSWTPTNAQTGTFNVTFTAANAMTGSATTSITVGRPPVVTAPATATTAEGSLLTVNVTAADPDGDAIATLMVADTTVAIGATFTTNASNTSGTFSWTPSFTQAGSYSLTFMASNELAGFATTNITVTNVDRAPVVAAPATASGIENLLLTFTVTAADPDANAITNLTAAPLPSGATFTKNAANTSGTFSWTPGFAQAGNYSVAFTAANALTGSATTFIAVGPDERQPVVTAPATATVAENSLLTVNVTATDPDGDPLTSFTATGTAITAGATFAKNATNTAGTLTWTPSFSQAGSYAATFTATNALVATATTNITVTNVDRAPVVAAPATAFGNVNSLLTFTVTAADPDGDAITNLTAAPLPPGAAFTKNAANTSGTFSWTPGFMEAHNSYSVTFTAASALTGSATTMITVFESIDRPPAVTAPATISGNEGTLITFTVTAADPDANAITNLTATGTAITAGATFARNVASTSGTFSWTPTFTQAGSYNVTFTAVNALTGSATTAITVTPGDQPPVVTAPATASGDEGTLINFTVSAADPDGDALTNLTANPAGSLPSGATFTKNATNTSGTFSWTPSFSQSGTYSVAFVGTNSISGSATTSITVNNVDQAPVANAGGLYTGVIGAAVTFNGSGSSDPDGDALSYAWDFGDGDASTAQSPTHTYITIGVYSVTLTVTANGLSGTDATTATITDRFFATAFTTGGNKTTSLAAGKPYTCIQAQPDGGAFLSTDVDLSSLRMVYPSGSASSIPADASKSALGGDKNSDGIQEVTACFGKADMRTLFAGLPSGPNTVTVDITGSLTGGGQFRATLQIIVKSNGTFLAAGISPNPLNPQAKLTFMTTKPGAVRVQMFDPQGRLVKTITDGTTVSAGYHDFTIDGRSVSGSKLASGVYFVKVWSQFDGTEVKSVTILK